VFAGLSFMFCPMLLQKLTIAEPDTVVTLLSFAAFAVWWDGEARKRVTPARWLACGALLAVMAMAKGPQPVGFFALGIAGFVLARRKWRDMAGLLICLALPAGVVLAWALAVYQPGDETAWRAYMRLTGVSDWQDYVAHNLTTALHIVVGLLPCLLLLPFVPWPRRSLAIDARNDVPVILPLALYAGLCTIALLLWPGANARYAMPIAPAVAVLAAIGWQGLEKRRDAAPSHLVFRHLPLRHFEPRHLQYLASAVVGAGFVYQVALVSVVMPMFADRFGASRLDGAAVDAAIAADPAPAYCTGLATNQLFYVHAPMRCIDQDEMMAQTLPAWIITSPAWLEALLSTRPDAKAGASVQMRSGPELVAARLESR
jgi:4-amino-4-deoxy-L-arabinose transferase-like glycosyltransferase